MGPIKWYRKNPRRGRERPVPWSLGLPIFDEKLGKYVPREPTKEPKKRVPSIRVSKIATQPLGNRHVPKKKRKVEWRKQDQKPTGVGCQTETTGGRAVTDLHGCSHIDGDDGLFFPETTAVNTGTIAGNSMDNVVVLRDVQQQRKGQTGFPSGKSTTDAGILKRKKQKRKQNFWEKPKPRKPPKMLSIRGEEVSFPYGKAYLW